MICSSGKNSEINFIGSGETKIVKKMIPKNRKKVQFLTFLNILTDLYTFTFLSDF